MANDYYTNASDVIAGNKAKAEDINSRMGLIEDGFDKLPSCISDAPASKGFDETFTIPDSTEEYNPPTSKQVRDGALVYAEDTGTANSIIADLSQTPTAYTTGMSVTIKVNATNTGATTLNLNSLGAKAVKRISGDDLTGGDIISGRVIGLRYNGTNFQLLDGMYAIHNHGDLYYTEDEIDTALALKSDTTHLHDDRYYTEAEVNAALLLKSDTTHLHDDRYYTEAEVAALIASAVPSGTVIGFSSEVPPAGYLECDGSLLSRTTYSDLFSEIGEMYGAGDGSTTFAIPDYRGQFLRAWDNSAGNDDTAGARLDRGDTVTGDRVGTLQAATTIRNYITSGSSTVATQNTENHSSTVLANCGGSVANINLNAYYKSIRPQNINVMFCIKH